jgi:hypothetical protein
MYVCTLFEARTQALVSLFVYVPLIHLRTHHPCLRDPCRQNAATPALFKREYAHDLL